MCSQMKKWCLFYFLVLAGLTAGAQSRTIFLFEDFVSAKIHFKTHSVGTASMNYDAGQGRMLYWQDDEVMEVTNAHMIDSISFGERQFIPLNGRYAEKIRMPHGIVYLNWVLKDVNIGSKGALGMPTQGKVEPLNNHDFGFPTEAYTAYDKQKVGSTDIYRRKNANTYYIFTPDGLTEIKNQKQLLKCFSGKEEEINQYISDTKVNLRETDLALSLLDFCLSL